MVMKNEFKRMCMGRNLGQYLSTGLEGQWKTANKPVQIVCVMADSNGALPKYKR